MFANLSQYRWDERLGVSKMRSSQRKSLVSLLELGELGHYLTPIEHIALQFVLATEMVNATLPGQLRFERFERMASATLRLYSLAHQMTNCSREWETHQLKMTLRRICIGP